MARRSSLFAEADYVECVEGLKQELRFTQVKAALAANQELILLYWQLGREILAKQEAKAWGKTLMERLGQDFHREFLDIQGLSAPNLQLMRQFALAYREESVVRELLVWVPWSHHGVLLEKLQSLEKRLWYAQMTLIYGWSHNVLAFQIDTCLYERDSRKVTEFQRVLPPLDSDLAQRLVKDADVFDLLMLRNEACEREAERGLLVQIRDFLLDLRLGFAFLGFHYPLRVSKSEYCLDLLFYHTKLRCYVVVDVEMKEFMPEFSGSMGFYTAVVDDLLRSEGDGETIGIILCKSKDQTIVDYSLSGYRGMIGVGTHNVQLPEELQRYLPTIEQLELQMERAIEAIDQSDDTTQG